jgi:hypothetical protein
LGRTEGLLDAKNYVLLFTKFVLRGVRFGPRLLGVRGDTLYEGVYVSYKRSANLLDPNRKSERPETFFDSARYIYHKSGIRHNKNPPGSP